MKVKFTKVDLDPRSVHNDQMKKLVPEIKAIARQYKKRGDERILVVIISDSLGSIYYHEPKIKLANAVFVSPIMGSITGTHFCGVNGPVYGPWDGSGKISDRRVLKRFEKTIEYALKNASVNKIAIP